MSFLIHNSQLILGFSLIVLGIIILFFLVWYYRLYRAVGLVVVSTIFSSPEKFDFKDEDENKLKIGVSTGLFYESDILESLPVIRDAGFKIIEIWAGPQRWGPYTHFEWHKHYRVHALSVCIKILGLKVNSLHAPFSDALDISDPGELRRQFAVNEVLRSLEILKYLGGEYLIVHPASGENSLNDRETRFKQSRKSIEEIFLCAQNLGLKLAVENQLPHILGGDVDTLLRLIDGLPPQEVGICFDTSHANLYYGQSLENAYQKVSDKVMALHISDNYGRTDDHFVTGDGNINWTSFFKLLDAGKFPGIFMLEILGQSQKSDKASVLKVAHHRLKNLLSNNPVVVI